MPATKVHEATSEVAGEAAPPNGHRLLSLEEIYAAELPHEDVYVPELGGSVRVRAFSGEERAEFSKRASEFQDDDTAGQLRFTVAVVAASMGADEAKVGKLASTVIDALGIVAMRLNGMGLGGIERALAALKETPNDESGSA